MLADDDSRQDVEGSPANSENLRTAAYLIAELSQRTTTKNVVGSPGFPFVRHKNKARRAQKIKPM